MQIIDMCSVASEVLADMAQIAWAKNIEIGIGEECSGSIRGSEDALKILLRNLIENAIRHTPSDGHVFIEIAKSHHGVILKVMDSGPGIPEEERDNVFNRFYRVLDNTTEGSGLGLSIVGRIAELHRANISLHSSKLGGLEVRLTFPSSSSE
jgi:two-component system OmpR family sensor kinase